MTLEEIDSKISEIFSENSLMIMKIKCNILLDELEKELTNMQIYRERDKQNYENSLGLHSIIHIGKGIYQTYNLSVERIEEQIKKVTKIKESIDNSNKTEIETKNIAENISKINWTGSLNDLTALFKLLLDRGKILHEQGKLKSLIINHFLIDNNEIKPDSLKTTLSRTYNQNEISYPNDIKDIIDSI